jgi:MFS transporter, CP family, cyanate transporter
VNNRPVNASQLLPLTALSLVAINLRIAITSVPPVVVNIKEATKWDDTALGILTTIPVLCMGLFALLVPRLAARIGRRHTIAVALALIALALVSRWNTDWPWLLYPSAFFAGAGIALAAGLLPGIVREQMPNSVGFATGVWTSFMMFGAAIGAALTVPIALALNSWGWALAVWSIPAIVGLVVWLIAERGRGSHQAVSFPRLADFPWRNPVAWSLTAYLTLNSIVFYSAVAWLAPSYTERGLSQELSGWNFGVFTIAQVIAALTMPTLAHRLGGRRIVLTMVVTLTAVSVLLIGWDPTFLPIVVLLVFGFTLGGGFALGLGLLSEYSSSAAASARLTAMAFFVTYCVAAFSPTIAGFLMDQINDWTAIYFTLAAVAMLQVPTIWLLRRNTSVA